MRYLSIVLFTILLLTACSKRQQTVKLTNTLGIERNDELVVLDLKRLFPNQIVNKTTRVAVFNKGKPLPSQFLFDHRLSVLLSFKPYEAKTLTIRLNAGSAIKNIQRAHAEISIRKGATFNGKKWVGGHFVSVKKCTVDQKHFIHDALIRYEGPGLESDKIAYRQYLDERNAMDVFGKRTLKIILPIVGHDSSKTYHKMNWWGMDILKVGETFGAGSFALYLPDKDFLRKMNTKGLLSQWPDLLAPKTVDSLVCRVLEDGPLRAGVEILYKGWQIAGQKVDVRARHYIQAGSYLVRHELEVEGDGPGALAFGIMEPENTDQEIWGDYGHWHSVIGIHSLAGDSLTIFFYFREGAPVKWIVKKNGNRVVYVKPQARKITFWSGALWQGNFSGQSFKKVGQKFAIEQSQRLSYPIQIEYKKD